MTAAAPPRGHSPVRTVLWIVLALAGLCTLGCLGLVVSCRDGIGFAWSFGETVSGLQTEFGPGTQIAFEEDEAGAVFAVGIPGFDPGRAAECQDAVWRIYTNSFAAGAPPIRRIAVGTCATKAVGGRTVHWKPEHEVSVADLAERTGIAVPPEIPFPGDLKIQTSGDDGDAGDPGPGDGAPPPDAPPPSETPR